MTDFFNKVFGGDAQTKLAGQQAVYVVLTQIGEQKLQQCEPTGRDFDVCREIKIKQPCNSQEVAESLHMPENKVKYVMEELYKKGWIAKA